MGNFKKWHDIKNNNSCYIRRRWLRNPTQFRIWCQHITQLHQAITCSFEKSSKNNTPSSHYRYNMYIYIHTCFDIILTLHLFHHGLPNYPGFRGNHCTRAGGKGSTTQSSMCSTWKGPVGLKGLRERMGGWVSWKVKTCRNLYSVSLSLSLYTYIYICDYMYSYPFVYNVYTYCISHFVRYVYVVTGICILAIYSLETSPLLLACLKL